MRQWPSTLRAVLALAAAYVLLLAVARGGLLPWFLLGRPAVAIMGVLAASMGLGLGLSRRWVPGLLGFPWLLDLLLKHPAPAWVWPSALAALLLVYGGGILTRVPLYNSRREAWEALQGLCPDGLLRFADLGAGLGGPLAFLARARPDGFFLGVETSPLTFALAWLRTLPVRGNCKVHWSSLWSLDLAGFDVVYAFLSPAPMAQLWEKVEREMRPGTLFISHTFDVPGREPDFVLPIAGRKDACLKVFRVGNPRAT